VLIRRGFPLIAIKAALLASVIGASAQALLFSPNLADIVPRQFDHPETAQKSSTSLLQQSGWSKLPPSYTFGIDPSGNITLPNSFRKPRELPPAGGVSSDQFRLGSSYLEIQTRKSLQPFDPLRPNGCETDEECAEYSGLPRSPEPSRRTLKGTKKPFIGLSITQPLQ